MSSGGDPQPTAVVDPVPEPRLTAVSDAPVGGQAVLEGVMMRGVRNWAVAVRKPATESGRLGEVAVQTFALQPWSKRRRVWRLPVIRGVVALVESLGVGLRALSISASAQLPDGEQEISGGAWFGTVLISIVFAIGLFFVVPVGLTSLIKHQLGS